MSYRVVRYSADLRPQVVSLLQHLMPGDDAIRDAYFRWKHEQNPFVAAPVAYVALHGDRVVGMRGFLGARWRWPDAREPKTVLSACDLVVAPAHRGKGLHRLIMDAALDGLRQEGNRTVLSFSASPVTFRASLRMGWRLIASYARWERVTMRARVAERATARVRTLPLVWRYPDAARQLVLRRGFDSMDARWRGAVAPSVEFTRELDVDFATALAAASRPRGTAHVRDAGYYRWRFRNPACEYRFVYAKGAAPGYIALQRPRYRPGAEMSIVDHAAPDETTLASMLAEIVRRGGFDRLSLWGVSWPAPASGDLRTLGFAPRGRSDGDLAGHPGVLAFDLDSALRDSSVPIASVDPQPLASELRMIDSDAY